MEVYHLSSSEGWTTTLAKRTLIRGYQCSWFRRKWSVCWFLNMWIWQLYRTNEWNIFFLLRTKFCAFQTHENHKIWYPKNNNTLLVYNINLWIPDMHTLSNITSFQMSCMLIHVRCFTGHHDNWFLCRYHLSQYHKNN